MPTTRGFNVVATEGLKELVAEVQVTSAYDSGQEPGIGYDSVPLLVRAEKEKRNT